MRICPICNRLSVTTNGICLHCDAVTLPELESLSSTKVRKNIFSKILLIFFLTVSIGGLLYMIYDVMMFKEMLNGIPV